MVIENDDTLNLIWAFDTLATGSYYMKDFSGTLKETMTPNEFYYTCMNKIGTKDFPVNPNMCEFVKTTYGKLIKCVTKQIGDYVMCRLL